MNDTLPLTAGAWEPIKRESKYLLDNEGRPTTRYLVNEEVTMKRRQRAMLNGQDPSKVGLAVVEVGTTQALYEARKATWELSQNGETLGTRSIFRDATPDEIAQYLVEKEAAIAARDEEVARSEMKNAPKVIVQNIGQPLEAAKGRKGK